MGTKGKSQLVGRQITTKTPNHLKPWKTISFFPSLEELEKTVASLKKQNKEVIVNKKTLKLQYR